MLGHAYLLDLEVNVLDATGDRILAGEELTKEAVLCLLQSMTDLRLALLLLRIRN